MPAITVRGVPDRMHRKLKRQAEAHNRSLNGEVLQLLEQAVTPDPSSGKRAGDVWRRRVDGPPRSGEASFATCF